VRGRAIESVASHSCCVSEPVIEHDRPVKTLERELVGREAELESLTAFLGDRDALPGGAVIEGPAGAGKTTLWRAALDHAEANGYLVLACRPAGAEVQLSLAGLSDLLEPHLAAVLPALPVPQRRALEVALLLEDDGGQRRDQRAVSAGVLNALRELARTQPVLLAIDDAQWLDGPSTAVIEYALRRLGDARVAVLASRRTSSATVRKPALVEGLRLERAFDGPLLRVEVGPLSLGAMHRLLRTRTGLDLNRRTLQRIHETSGGNPFYALELARAVERSREVSASGGAGASAGSEPLPLSADLSELLGQRLADLPAATRDALFVAAAASQPTLDLLDAVIERSADAALSPAIEASIVRIEDGAIEFVHPLLAAAAYATEEASGRRRWHARLADASADPEARARHLALARQGPDAEVAALLHEAARLALIRGAPAAAAELFAEAVARLPGAASLDRAQWTIEAAPILLTAGDATQARTMLELAVGELPAGPLRSDGLLLLAGLMDDATGGNVRALQLVEQALVEAGSDAGRQAAALLDREQLERSQDSLGDALPIARRALGLAEEAGDLRLLAHAHTRTADLEVVLGIGGEPVARFQRALELHALVHVDAGNSAPSMLAVCLIRRGRLDEARPFLLEERLRTIAEGDEGSHQAVCLFLAELEWLAGRWDDAATYADEGMQIAVQAGMRLWHGVNLSLAALVEASRGDPERARSMAVAARAICESVGEVAYANYARQILAFLEVSLGNAAAAHEQLETYSIDRGVEGTKRLSFIGDEIEALVLLGELERAATLIEELARRGGRLDRPTLLAAAGRGRALLLGVRGDLEGAGRAAAEAVEIHTALRLPFERARSLLVLGEVQRRSKQRRAARETLTEAAAAFEALGAARWAGRAEAERARVGGRSTIEGLSETELRVAQLVAEGRSNKEVAAALFVSVRAVESNLSKVYAKLGIRSRTELARRI
jgi:ATP/maltotriose-dependent transcriptional regulator MalT